MESKHLGRFKSKGFSETLLTRNEYLGAKQKKPYSPNLDQGEASEETEEEFDWYRDDPILAES